MKREEGSVMIWVIIILPVILAVVGLLIDGGMILYYQTQLDMATEAASVSTISAYDREAWNAENKVRINNDEARISAEKYLTENFKEARVEKIDYVSDSTVTLETTYIVKMVFTKIFGVTEVEIKSSCTMIGG